MNGSACVVATLSCLGFGAAVADARAQAGAAADGTAAIRRLLSELDALFDRGDLDAYAARFAPDHAGALEMRRRQLARWVRPDHRMQRTSTIGGEPREVGGRTVLRVHHELRGTVPAGPDGGTRELVLREDTMLALRRRGDGRFVPTFEVEVAAQSPCLQGEVFRCPPCNYEIGGIDGWLCVPEQRERGQSLDAADFWLIGTDVVCSVAVRVDCRAPTAAQMATELATTFHELGGDTAASAPVAWTPKALAGDPPAGLDGVRLDVRLAGAGGASGGRAILHVVVFAGLQHILLARGSDAALQAHAAQLQQLIDSYRLILVDPTNARLAAQALQHHTGGSLDGVRYRNDAFGVSFDGPAGWRAEQRCGGAAFHVRWTSPNGSRVYLRGHRAPAGMTAWCPTTADRWVHQLCESAKIEAAADGADASWTEHATCGGRSRTIVCVPRDRSDTDAPQRVIRLLLRGDLLLVVDSATHGEADDRAVQAAVQTLRAK